MQEMSQRAHEIFCRITKKSKEFLKHERTNRVLYVGLQVLLSIGILLAGKEMGDIASGRTPGVSPSVLPTTLPLLLSGTLYIDRFAAVFCVILSALLLIQMLKGGKGTIKEGVRMGVIALGVIAASTPLTLVAWILLLASSEAGRVAQKQRLLFLMSMGALGASVLLFSGGAFLADMTIVATISSQLPQGLTLLALGLLFGGALGSVRSLRGMYALVPAYIVLRISLFFLGSVSAVFLTAVSLIAVVAALLSAQKKEDTHAYTKSTLLLLFVAVPFTMLAVQAQNITAVQCFLFGGLFMVTAGILMDTVGIWTQKWKRGGTTLMRLLGSPLPGTAMGNGAMLFLGGLWALAEQTPGVFERGYVVLVAVLFIKTILLLSRRAMQKHVQSKEGVQMSGLVQIIILGALAVFFAQILAYLGTTIGGDTPDWIVTLPLMKQTLSYMPIAMLGVGVAIVGGAYWIKTTHTTIWEKIIAPMRYVFAKSDAMRERVHIGSSAQAKIQRLVSKGNYYINAAEVRMAPSPTKETALLILICFVATLVVLF